MLEGVFQPMHLLVIFFIALLVFAQEASGTRKRYRPRHSRPEGGDHGDAS